MASSDSWFQAAQLGDLQFIRNYVTQFKTARDADGNTALMVAAGFRLCQLVDQLAVHEYGLKNSLGQTALMLAAIKGCAHCVATLAPFEAGQLTHQGKSALMMALFNGNADAARVLLPHELYLTQGECSPDSYLRQALEKGPSVALKDLQTDMVAIRQNKLWPYLQVLFRRLDNTELVAYKAYQTTRKVDSERRQQSFEQNVSLTNLPLIKTPSKPPSASQISFHVKSDKSQPLPAPAQTVSASAASLSPATPSMNTKDMRELREEIKQVAGRLQAMEKQVKAQPQNVEFLLQRQSDADAVVNGVIKSVEELRQNLTQMMDYSAAFSKTVMGMLGKRQAE